MSATPRDPAWVSVLAAPSTIAVGRSFQLPGRIGPSDPNMAWIDATVPGHRHVANDRPRLQSPEAGRWTVVGMPWLVPGRWGWRFDVDAERRVHLLRRSAVRP